MGSFHPLFAAIGSWSITIQLGFTTFPSFSYKVFSRWRSSAETTLLQYATKKGEMKIGKKSDPG